MTRNETIEQHEKTPLTDFRILLAEPAEKSRDTLSTYVSMWGFLKYAVRAIMQNWRYRFSRGACKVVVGRV